VHPLSFPNVNGENPRKSNYLGRKINILPDFCLNSKGGLARQA
jgi:hypothetical protein